MSGTLAFFRNVVWLIFCFILALFIWVFATFQRDPIVQRSYIQVPIDLRLSDDIQFLEEPRRSATVFIRAPESLFTRFTRDDISLFAALDGLGSGQHSIKLQAKIHGGHSVAIADVSPSEITVMLDKEITQEIEVQVELLGEMLPGYYLDELRLQPEIVKVIGPASDVERVSQVRADLTLSGQRNSFSEDVDLVAANSNGLRNTNVRILPEQVTVHVEIATRDDIQQIAVHQPPLDFSSLPWGYYPSSIQFDPQFIFVSGTPEQLAALPEYFTTERVDLSDRTEDFEVEVPINIPIDLKVIDSQQTVRVQIGIAAQEGYRQFDEITVQVIGLPDGIDASVTPQQVAIYLAGPLPVLKRLNADLVQAQIDASGLSLGSHSVPPMISTPLVELDVTSLSVVPALLELELRLSNDE